MLNEGRSAGRAIPSLLADGVDDQGVDLGFAGDVGGHRGPPGDRVQPHVADDEQIRMEICCCPRRSVVPRLNRGAKH